MTTTSIVLTDPSSGYTVPIMSRDGVTATGIDASAPARAVVESRVGARGGVDTTRNLDAGVLSLSLILWPGLTQTPEAFLDEIAPLLDPRLRPALVVSNDAWPNGSRRALVRYDSIAKPQAGPDSWPVQINWTVPAACWEDAAPVTAVINAFIAASTGLVIDVPGLVVTSAGYTMPATTAVAPQQVISPGKIPSQWTALIYGPCTGPKLANDTAAATIEFTDGMSLDVGEYLLVDSQAQTALLNGDPGQDRTGLLNFSTLTWWQMQQGLNVIRYYPTTADAGANAQITFRGAYPL